MFAETERDLKTLVGIRNPDAYFAAQITCTGTGANETCLLALEGLGKGLILHNGFFAARAVDQAVQNHIDHAAVELPADRPLDPASVDAALARNPDVKWVFFVSHETRTGLANPMEKICRVCKDRGLFVAADVISSAWAYPIDIEASQLDLAAASSAKALMAAPGIGIIFVKLASVPALESAAKNRGYYLDLIAELDKQRHELQPRFAQPIPLHAAMRAACIHLKNVGIDNHMRRIRRQMDELISCLEGLDAPALLEPGYRSGIAVNFRLPNGMEYPSFAKTMQTHGYYLLYGIPGDDTHFQLSTIGDLSDEHVDGLKAAFSTILASP